MLKLNFIVFCIFCAFVFSCKKDTIIVEEPPDEPAYEPTITFVFVNRFGYKNDSTKHGVNDTVFSGIGIDGKYYTKSKNITNLTYSAFNRNYYDPENRLSDSVTFLTGKHTIAVGDKYGYKISLKWVNTIFPYATKVLEYTTKNFNNGGDTIKTLKDTTIKFIWPNDSNSNKFIKTFQFP
jgi:hypothetical protein